MASTAAEEQMYIDGTHPSLAGNAQAMSTLRSNSPTRSISPSSSASSSPRFTAIDPDPPTSPLPSNLNLKRNSTGASNTGPKGVLADYKARNNSGSATYTGPKGVLADWKGSQAAKADKAIDNLKLNGNGIKIISLDDLNWNGINLNGDLELGGSEDDEELIREFREENKSEEDKAIERYRRKRMMELSGSGNVERNGRSIRKVFGHLREIGMDQFLSAIEDEHPDVAVVLHLYEPHIETCILLNHHLSSIARDYPNTKFIRALATEVDFSSNSEDDTLPTVLIYRGGELETTLVRFDHEWGTGARAEIIELLERNNAIPDHSAIAQARESHDSDEYE